MKCAHLRMLHWELAHIMQALYLKAYFTI